MDKAASSGIDFRLVPQELMPVPPIESFPTSIQMYENHMEVINLLGFFRLHPIIFLQEPS